MKRPGTVLMLLTLLLPAGANASDVFTYSPIKHATLVLQSGPITVYIDPVGETGDFVGFPPPDLILVTHIHKDHFAPDLVAVLKQEKTRIFGPPTVIEQLGYGMPLKNGESTTAFGLTIEAVPAYNLNADRRDFHPQGRDNGYVLSKDGDRLYFSGDTEDTPEMRDLRDIDVAFLCMNLPYTMTVEQAASAVNAFQPKLVIPYHYRGKAGMSDLDAFERLVTGSQVSRLKWY
jgi:L-ascorbate metabolism protein UlaG (beta-lactamase superfamily)